MAILVRQKSIAAGLGEEWLLSMATLRGGLFARRTKARQAIWHISQGGDNEPEEFLHRHLSCWLFCRIVHGNSEHGLRPNGREDRKIYGDLEGHDCEIGNAKA